MRKFADRIGYGGQVLRQTVARVKLNVSAVLECQQTDAVKFLLEDPFRPGETLLSQRGRHRLNPFGEFRDGWHVRTIRPRLGFTEVSRRLRRSRMDERRHKIYGAVRRNIPVQSSDK